MILIRLNLLLLNTSPVPIQASIPNLKSAKPVLRATLTLVDSEHLFSQH